MGCEFVIFTEQTNKRNNQNAFSTQALGYTFIYIRVDIQLISSESRVAYLFGRYIAEATGAICPDCF